MEHSGVFSNSKRAAKAAKAIRKRADRRGRPVQGRDKVILNRLAGFTRKTEQGSTYLGNESRDIEEINR